MRYYNREGEQVPIEEWLVLFEDDLYRRVALDSVHDGAGREHSVSTVLLGADHQFGEGPPLIFETMVFCGHGSECDLSNEMARYSTEEQAREGHEATVALVRREAVTAT